MEANLHKLASTEHATKTRIEDLSPASVELTVEMLNSIVGGARSKRGRLAVKKSKNADSAGTTSSSGASDDD